ncbi:MAG TPA: nicotinate-nucleotide--dimethylbenzimidazole phosphoribosyltransferase [Dehalococcoidia bacterium]
MTLTLPHIPALDSAATDAAAARLDQLTKPQGSLGLLEALAVRLAGIQRRALPSLERKLVVVAAADHGITAQGVSAYPSEVTGQMVRNFLAGGAAINVLARAAGADILVVDAGIKQPIADVRIVDMRMGAGTADFSREPAMSRVTAEEALARGIDFGRRSEGYGVIACGEMGIGNTTAASAVAAALLGLRAADVTGPGTGVSIDAVAAKRAVIDAALALHRPDPSDAVDVLSKVGGFEIAVLAGIMIGAASMRRVVVVDGVISGAAALAAARLVPECVDYMVAAHLSTEPGHAFILSDLGLSPLLDLNLRLGEGTGAALALPILDAACRILSEMATFEEAAVSGRSAGEGPGLE